MSQRSRVLNVLVAGHAQHGKSSLIEAIVGTFPDNLDFELSHGTTVTLKVIQFMLNDQNLLLNFLDSPGHADFKAGIALGLEFADLLVLVISGKEGFQARTYWLYEKAREKNIPIIVAATKMDLPFSSIEKIQDEFKKLNGGIEPIIETSAKQLFGIKELVNKIPIYVKKRKLVDKDLKFIILGFNAKKGLGEVINIGILSGKVESGQWLSEEIKVRVMYSLKGKPINEAYEGEIVQIALNVDKELTLGTKYFQGKFISSKIEGLLSEIKPRKEFHIKVEDPSKFKIALDSLEQLKKTLPSFDFYVDKENINVLVMGDLQFDFIKENLESLIEFKTIDSQIKGIITIDKNSKSRFKSAKVRIAPRFKDLLTVNRPNEEGKKLYDILGASAAREAFHIDGLHVDILSGKNEDDIAQAIAKAIEKVKIIKIVPHQDVIVKVENYHNIFPLIEKYDVEVLYQSQTNTFFLQVKNQKFENFFNSLMKVSDGMAEIKLFKFDQSDKILSIDPGTRHFGFCLIERGELPSLWYVNLKRKIDNSKAERAAAKQLKEELDIFLENDTELINKIFVGSGPGADFVIDFLINYFQIPCEDRECVITNLDESKNMVSENKNLTFKPPEIFLVDEFKTTKEALYHLQQGKLINEVTSKGFVDHAIAALLIAKRGIKGEVVEIEKKPMDQLKDYVVENYAGSYSFSGIHNINSLEDLRVGTYLRVKETSKLDSSLNKGDIISFNGFGSSYNSLHATTLSGNKIIVKFHGNVRVKSEFFSIFSPVKEST